ncbi:TetR family transcriptional regulator [Aliifodinibius salipaludis]|uniref:TetR family transcriptional regulator n=1 Tax=Fodinibius salipaludis TaxID=2032627 RepID=A0A2A2G703_9BACT|nr:TetR/AcrR family transcriptional regulator [Aliifodinibius salipaludis]PAU93411.1 TetR family transcriptional regulator [Aliifodinibius salipaludis]
MSEELQTQEQILEAAKQVFQERGFSGARMQEIADEAEINKSMLHYYFRSKDKLFQKVFQDSIRQFFPEILKVLNADLALVPKIEKLVETYYEMFKKHPHLPRFVIHEMNQHPDRFRGFVRKEGFEIPERFVEQIKTEIASGTMRKIDPREFIINTIGLCVFPLIARPMVETVFDMSEDQYRQFLEQRKKELPKFILNAVKR